MQLIKLELEGFGKFADKKTINFNKGINFIGGLNEAGKSTILEAIMASIFKFNKREIDPFFSWNNDHTCKVALTYTVDNGETFRITSDYKDNRRKLEKITKNGSNEISSVDKNIGPYLKEHFGFNDKKVFENTAFIRQTQIAILEDTTTKNKIKDMIEEVFSGRAKASATKAIKKIKDFSKEASKKVEQLSEEKIKLNENLEEAHEIKSNVTKDSTDHEKVSKELDEKRGRLEKLEKNKRLFDEKESLLKDKENVDGKISNIDEWTETFEEEKKEEPVKQKRTLPIILIIVGILISLSGEGAIIGIPLAIYGAYLLLKKPEILKKPKSNISEKIENYKKQKKELINKKAVLEEQFKKYKLVNFTIDDFNSLDELKKEVSELNDKKIELQTSVKTTTSLVESPEEIKEKLDAVNEKIEELQNKIEDNNLATHFLERAEAEVYHKFTPSIEKDSKSTLKSITHNRYSNLKIDEETLDITIKAPEIKEYVDVSMLSQGTRDQIYFTLRTVMVNLLSGNLNIPLILDDPFHNFDEIRLKKTIEVIKNISKEKQIILISHRPYHNDFKDFAKKVIKI